MANKHKFIENWIHENFVEETITVTWEDGKAIITDSNGEKMIVEMRDRTLYADGKPYGGIPSLADIQCPKKGTGGKEQC